MGIPWFLNHPTFVADTLAGYTTNPQRSMNTHWVPVRCAASPGFIVPRIQALAMNEAARMVEEGVASVEDIDKASRVGFGLRFAILGLLEFIDWGGGDILYYADNFIVTSLWSKATKEQTNQY